MALLETPKGILNIREIIAASREWWPWDSVQAIFPERWARAWA